MAAHLLEPAVVGALLAHKDRVHRGLHVVVDAPRAGALVEGEGPVVGVEHHFLALARIGPHEGHPAVAEPHVRDLDRHGDAVDQHDLVAPVELVGLARIEAQRHEGRRRRGRLPAPPLGCIAPYRVVAALVTEPTQVLEDPQQRDPLTPIAGRIHRQQSVQLLPPRSELRLRLDAALVLERNLPRAENPPHRIPRNVQLTSDLPDRPAAHKVLAANPRNRIHALHPLATHPETRTGSLRGTRGGGSTFDADPAAHRVNIPRRSTTVGTATSRRST